jgi:hypothetical protein
LEELSLTEFFQMLLEYLKGRKYWKKIQPFVLLGFGFVTAELLAFEYIQWQFGFKPSLRLFIGSYFFIRVAIVFAGLSLLMVLFQRQTGRSVQAFPGKIAAFVRRHQSVILFRTIAVLAVLVLTLVAFRHFGPHQVSTIRIMLLNEPASFKSDALAYVVYELNRQQKHWFYELDFEPFNPGRLTTAETEDAAKQERPKLYYSELIAKGQPLIGITEESLGGAYFCEHRSNVSVISTIDKDYYAPLSTYEYLAYCLVVQSILIHLDVHGGGLPAGAFEPSAASHGGVFQFNPNKDVLKATILAAQLSPDEEAMLFNKFGADYMNVCRQLLTLDWLRSERVVKNLAVQFGISNAVSGVGRAQGAKE